MKAIGIDLGTTNSLAAIVLNGQARVFRDGDGRGLLASIIGYDSDQNAVVGHRARSLEAADGTIFSVKRLMGRTRDEAIALGFDGQRLRQNGPVLEIEVGGGTAHP